MNCHHYTTIETYREEHQLLHDVIQTAQLLFISIQLCRMNNVIKYADVAVVIACLRASPLPSFSSSSYSSFALRFIIWMNTNLFFLIAVLSSCTCF